MNLAPNTCRRARENSSSTSRPAWSRSTETHGKPSERPIQLRCAVRTFSGQRSSRSAVEQILREGGDLEEPLRELALLHDRARAPAAPSITCSLASTVCDRVPVHLRLLALDQARAQKIEEHAADCIIRRRSRSHAQSSESPIDGCAFIAAMFWCPGGGCGAPRSPPACRASQPIGWSTFAPIARLKRDHVAHRVVAHAPYGCAPTDGEHLQHVSISAADRRCAWRRSPGRPRPSATASRNRGRCSVRGH
jgi:hypothetical protein